MSLMEVAGKICGLLNLDQMISGLSFIDFCEQFPDKKLFTFIPKNNEPVYLTGKDLARKVKILGSILQQKLASQEKVLLLFDQGLEYIISLLSCWYANVIAVPISVTNLSSPEKIAEKAQGILSDSQAKMIITNNSFADYLTTRPALNLTPILSVDEPAIARPQDDFTCQPSRLFAPDDLGLLLYTSGSTSKPKGVMISHQNLMSRAQNGKNLWGIRQESCIVSWMPQFHSFGLDFNILTPLSQGASSIIFSPAGFLENPEDWFRLIHQYQATHTGAPNFAYDYCYSTIDISAVQAFSLQSLQAIVCGGEPVRKETCRNFFNKFRSLGLNDTVFCPEYGLSEAGSVVAKKPGQPLDFLTLDITSLEQGIVKHTRRKNKVKPVTSCGEIGEGVVIRIVHPETGELCAADQVGEIWLQSPAVARGYFSLEPEISQTFLGNLKNENEGFLRTGDLGFIEDNRLYVVGRRKEVIIINGKNHHPVDIEWTIQKHLPELQLPVAVFACEIGNAEKIIVVLELEHPLGEPEYNRLVQRIIAAVSENHELEIYEINLVEKGGIPKTGSGKVQRKDCRSSYMNQELPVLYCYRQGSSRLESGVSESSAPKNQHIIETLKREVFLPLLRMDNHRIETAVNLSELGLDSIQYVRIAKRIETVFKIPFTPVFLFQYRSFEKLAQYLATQIGQPRIHPVNHGHTPDTFCINPPGVGGRDIAIIGISGHFPGGVVEGDSYWENLAGQKDCITSIIESRPMILKDDQNYYRDTSPSFPQWGGFIEDVAAFDASFFRISPMEAECMDPQQRKLLELTWHVIEDSGYTPSELADQNIGLFVGVHNIDYAELAARQSELTGIYGTFLDSGLHMSMIAHRVSRWFNFHGPSEIINTACSSSLVAVHHAVESICRGESSLAIAGGINLILSSRVYRACQEANMLSKDGRCKTFDAQADGFVRSEGYGAILLKPLASAIKDRNTIYGVIKRAVINHDGQSNSLRAPNLNAQKRLIQSAYRDSGLPLETISYIEAHGTGTALGDPIEVQALQEAFREMKPDLPEGYCGLGTVKTNIGHCESAAGIAGLIKVLLAIKHGTLPGLPFFNKLNPYIQLKGTPFYIVDQTREWKRLRDSQGQEIPRRAGISSFGLGGANAHVVVEEYLPGNTAAQTATIKTNKAIIPISAKNRACLREYVQKLHAFLVKGQNPARHPGNVDLLELAYTLQTGREAMEERVVFVVKDIPELIGRLAEYAQAGESGNDCRQGRAKQGEALLALFGGDEDAQELIHQWVVKGKLEKIAQYWAQGGTIDWDSLYGQEKPRRISLPAYPFAKEYYWIPEPNPLIQRVAAKETAWFASGIVFETVVTPVHSGASDHIVNGRPVLPVSAYIEMIQAAIREINGNTAIEIEELVCQTPLVVTDESVIQLRLSIIDQDRYRFQIIKNDAEPVIYSHGRARSAREIQDVYINYQAFQRAGDLKKDMRHFYERLAQVGIELKGSHCSLQRMWVNGKEVLGELHLKDSGGKSGYGCHPVLNAAFQTQYELSGTRDGFHQIIHIMGAGIYGNIPSQSYSYLKLAEDGEYYQFALLDPDGKIIVQIDRIQTQKLANLWDELMYLPVWEEQFGPGARRDFSPKQDPPETVLIVYSETSSGLEKTIRDYYRKNKITGNVIQIQLNHQTQMVSAGIWMCDIHDPLGFETCLQAYDFIHCVYFIPGFESGKQAVSLEALAQNGPQNEIQLLRLFKVLQAKNKNHQPIDCYIITQDNYRTGDTRVNPCGSGITGLAYSIAQGDYRFAVRNIDISREDLETSQGREQLCKLILAEEPSERGELIKFRNGGRYRRTFLKLEGGCVKKGSGFRNGGVYVILGGSGALGMIISRYLMKEYNARVVWLGRQAESSHGISEKLQSFRDLGNLRYIQADATCLDTMKDAVMAIKQEYPAIHGAIFCGIVFEFKKLDQIHENEFLEMIDVKTTGSLNFYRAFQDEPLDFMCFFSSIQAFSFTEAANSGAYASGVTFTDSFVHYIQDQSRFPVGTIHWGYWKSSPWNALFRDIKLLEDEEAIGCFEHFTGRLRENTLHQVACFKASRLEQEFMECKTDEAIAIYEKSSGSMIQFLIDSPVTGRKTIESFKNKTKDQLEKWVPKLLFAQMRQLGLFKPTEKPKEIAEFCEAAGIIPKYRRWMHECIEILESHGYLRCNHGKAYVSASGNPEIADIERVWHDWDQAKEAYYQDSEWETQARLVDACMRKLPEILKGEIQATDVLFPDSSIEMVARVYKGNAVSDYFNMIVADIIEKYVRRRMAQKAATDRGQTKVRIIEAGAGTGATSLAVFSRLKPYLGNIEYCYTDISKAFLLYAEEKYGPDNPFLEYKLWNVDKPLADQGIDAGGYDVVIATNVLHASPNIRRTIRNTKAALKNKGILVLNEITGKSILATVTLGLSDGWWLSEDTHLRIPGSPVLYPETWRRLLEEEGFRGIQFPAEQERMLGQQVILAESDGIVRRKVKNHGVQNEAGNIAAEPFLQTEGTISGQFGTRPKDSGQVRQKTLKEVAVTTAKVAADAKALKDAPATGARKPEESIQEYVIDLILNHLSKSLKVSKSQIDSTMAFSDYGVDSIIGVSFIKQVNAALGISMNTAILFDYTSVHQLANYITKTYPVRVPKPTALSASGVRCESPSLKNVKSLNEMFAPGPSMEKSREPVVFGEAGNQRLIQALEKQFLADEISVESLIEIALNKGPRNVSHEE